MNIALDEPTTTQIADALANEGVFVAEDFVDAPMIARLRARAQSLHASGAMHAAGIGRKGSARTAPNVRGDMIAWLEADSDDATDHALNAWLAQLRGALNRTLYLGLDHEEVHFAIYPPGAGYAKHLDRHRDSDVRVVTLVLYLNDGWQSAWGGQLALYDAQERPLRTIEPRGGTLVLFRAEQFPHEVLPAHHERISITGWFRRRA